MIGRQEKFDHASLFVFYIKRSLTKGKQKYVKKIPLVARFCKGGSRRKEAMGGSPVNIRGVLTLLF